MQANAKKAKTPQPAPQVISHEVQTPPGWQSSDKLEPSLYGEHALKAAELAGRQLEPQLMPAEKLKPAGPTENLASGCKHFSKPWVHASERSRDRWATALPDWPMRDDGMSNSSLQAVNTSGSL